MTITLRTGDRCTVIRPASSDRPMALVRRDRDGREFEVAYEDLGSGGSNSAAFYGIESGTRLKLRQTKTLRKMRNAWKWREVPV